jgi:uncharacterized protein involved in outer membrane biogenesis
MRALTMPRSRAGRAGVIAAAILLVIALVVVFFPWNAMRGPIGKYVSARLDRTVTIGALDVDFGRRIRIDAQSVTVANVAWSATQPMIDAGRMVISFTWGGLFTGVPARIRLEDTRALLERDAQGRDNWHFGSSEGGTVPRIGNIEVARSQLRYVDAKADADITLALDSASGEQDEATQVAFKGEGKLHGEPVTLEGESMGLAELQDMNDPYRFRLHAVNGKTVVDFEGTIVPSDTQNVQGQLAIAGPDMSKLYPVVPTPIPWTPKYKLEGKLSHTDGTWHYTDFKGVVGTSDLAGTISVNTAGERPATKAQLVSRRFDYKDLGGFVGLPPGKPAIEKRMRVSEHALPDKPFDLGKLREHDVDIQFRGESVKWERVPLDNLKSHLILKNGLLKLAPANFGLAGGHVLLDLAIDVSQDVPKARGEATVRNVELKRLFPELASPRGTAGRIGGRAKFETRGNSVADMMAAADGELALIMRGGEASTLTLVLTNLDLARAAELLLRGDQTAEIRCAVASLRARDGVMTPELFVVDTSAVLITGEGSVNFDDESYDALLRANSKEASLLALRGPIVIKGTFKDPVVRPAVGPVALRIGAAIGLGAIAPPLALLPLIDFGGAPDVDCRNLMQAARTDAAPGKGSPPAKKK